jgi:choline dehydrogenase-like flavoprotein
MHPDVIVIGSGAGGAPLTKRLADLGLHVLLLERGRAIPKEPENWNPRQVLLQRRYLTQEAWKDAVGKPVNRYARYNIGGATKYFGSVMIRFREQDFLATEHLDGTSPAWPFSYSSLEPYYGQAEQLFGVHGATQDDPTEPYRSTAFPFPAVKSEPFVAEVEAKLRRQGLHPNPLPVAVDLHEGGKCIRCATCDGFPCLVGAKNDAETRCVAPALETGRVTLWANAVVLRLVREVAGSRIASVEVEHQGELKSIVAKTIVLSAGALNSALLLMRSADSTYPAGIANSSGMVGRHYMGHNFTAIMAVSQRRNPTHFQKTMSINDFYLGDTSYPYPMGNVQMLGKLQADMLKVRVGFLPAVVGRFLTARSVDLLVTTEDLPKPNNRVVIDGGAARLAVVRSNADPHKRLAGIMTKMMKQIGFPLVLTNTMPLAFSSAQCGTVRMGDEPSLAPLDGHCRAYDHPNLFVVDASCFPSSGSVNPSLTIAAQALRVADHIAKTEFGIQRSSAS